MSNGDRIFEALSSTPRRRILAYIADGPLSAGEIASRFEMSQPAISKHLAVLKNAGLVRTERNGQFITYHMEQENLAGTLAGFLQEVCPPSRAIRKERIAELSKQKTD